VWLLRQAGRYLPEYRSLRERHSMLELIRAPELAAQVTLMPVHTFGVDAAIVFSDILPPLVGMGFELDFVQGDGPRIANPIASTRDVDLLAVPPAEETMAGTLEAIRIVRAELEPRDGAVIGFAGAPFTLATYLVEGGASSTYRRTKTLMHGDPGAWSALMERLVRALAAYVNAQIAAGAQAIQLFDSWVGALAPADYRRHVLPHMRRLIGDIDGSVPLIHFGTDTGGLLECLGAAGGDVVGLDWRVDLDAGWARLGDAVAVQGNLDPTTLFAPIPTIRDEVARILGQAGGRPGHVFNLGHGVLPETPVDHVRALVDAVHELSAR
jgi:uroporphyrinogen decarboxylase